LLVQRLLLRPGHEAGRRVEARCGHEGMRTLLSSGHGTGVHCYVPLPRVAVGRPWCVGPAVETSGGGGLARRTTTTPAVGAVLAIVAAAITAIAVFVVILGLLLREEEAGGLDVVTGSGGLRLSVLGLLDDGLEPSTEGSSLSVVRHGDRTWQRTDSDG
jgi:hypothetical protein